MSKLSDAVDARDEAIEERDEAVRDFDELSSLVAADHEEHHAGAYRWCERPACRWLNRGDE